MKDEIKIKHYYNIKKRFSIAANKISLFDWQITISYLLDVYEFRTLHIYLRQLSNLHKYIYLCT